MEFTFLYFGIKISLVEILKYFFNILVVFRHVIRVDEYIIQIDHNIDVQNVRENVIYKSLKGLGALVRQKGIRNYLNDS